MESDLSVPPSPSSDASSPTQSPGERGAIEPMDLTDFIGSLHAEEPKSPNGSSPTQDRKASISTGSKEVDQKIQDKEWKRLLDKDYDYSGTIRTVCEGNF